MKIKMDMESVYVLNDFAEKIPQVLEDINDSTQKLQNVYYNLRDSIGPHSAQFEEMIQRILNAQEISYESIKELAFMLKTTSEKMENYIQHGSKNNSMIVDNESSIQQQYSSAIKKRVSMVTNKEIKEFYEEYSPQIRIFDYDYYGTPFYNSLANGIKLNASVDLNNITGSCSTYFHEVGHMLDNLAGNGHAWLSSDPRFKECLIEDAENYIKKTMLQSHCDRQEAYDIISEELSGNLNAGVSDIFGSLTDCRCQGDWGHHYTYWKQDESKITKEAFANMFEASMGDDKKLDSMKKFFPLAYSRFEIIVRSRYK